MPTEMKDLFEALLLQLVRELLKQLPTWGKEEVRMQLWSISPDWGGSFHTHVVFGVHSHNHILTINMKLDCVDASRLADKIVKILDRELRAWYHRDMTDHYREVRG